MTHRKRVLLVENDPKTLELVRKSLEHHKLDLLEAASAEEALDILEREDVHLIVCHVQMSGMSGTDFLSELRNWDSEIPVILTSDEGREKEWLDALQSDADALLTRPLRKETILKAVQKAFQKSEALSAL
ncbi:MAG: response regulator [Elusimicrobia bacterium]|nr:response regulator [Elusimicrobiota bacterium]